jgi:drug/metabolite transporter (DMT)-like permease
MNSNPVTYQNIKAYFYLFFANLFWAGNFTIGKFASIENIPPYTLSFLRWLLVWLILFPFTFKEIRKNEHLSTLWIIDFGNWNFSNYNKIRCKYFAYFKF